MSAGIERRDEITIRDEYDDTKVTTFSEKSYDFRILQNPIIENGKVVLQNPPVKERREYYLKNIASLNDTQKRLINPHFYKVDISDELYDLKNNLINSLVKEIKESNEKIDK